MRIFKTIIGQGEPVVIIHGGAASHFDMMPIVNTLSRRYQVINIDLPGVGQSSWSDNIHTIHDIADHVLAEMPEQAIYVGWSFGGLVAQSIAARYPHRVKHLVGVCTTPKFMATENWPGVPAPGFSGAIDQLHKSGKGSCDLMQIFYEAEFANINPKPPQYQETKKLWLQPSMMTKEVLAKIVAICDATDLRNEFKAIACPIDLIMGEQDDTIPAAALVNIKKLTPRVSIHKIQGAGHVPFWTHPEAFNAILNQIL